MVTLDQFYLCVVAFSVQGGLFLEIAVVYRAFVFGTVTALLLFLFDPFGNQFGLVGHDGVPPDAPGQTYPHRQKLRLQVGLCQLVV